MRSIPRILILLIVASMLFLLASASASAQELRSQSRSHAFGKVEVGSSSSYSIDLSNTGSKPLRITSKSIEGSAFSFGTFPVPVRIKPGASLELPIVFTPASKGRTTGIITLVSTAKDSPFVIDVEGTGVACVYPELTVTPATLSFGNVTVGSRATLPATLTASNLAVTISSDESTSSEFALLGLELPLTIPAGHSVPVTIQFTPNGSGTASAKEEFISNANDSPTVQQLTGTGVAQAPHDVYLSWEAGTGNAVGYNVYRSSAKAGPFTEINTALDASTNYTDYNVVASATYYYVTTEVNAEGQESARSNVAEAVIP